MSENITTDAGENKEGMRAHPYAVFSLILGIISFVQLMGLERALAAVIFGVFALKGINKNENSKGAKYAYWGISLGIAYLAVLAVIVFYKRGELLCLLRQK